MATDYTTFDDLFQHLLLRYNLTPVGVTKAHVLNACREGYRRLFALHDWNFFKRYQLINVGPIQDDGTIEYTHSTRTVTLTGDTWPSNVEFGDLRINEVRYQILYKASSTEVVLPEDFNPGEDIDSGTSYQWAQHRFPLVFEARDITEILDSEHPTPMTQIDYRSAMYLTDSYLVQTFPRMYTVFPSQLLPGIWEIWIPSAVPSDRSVKVMYDKRHSPLTIQHETGTGLSVSGNVATFSAGFIKEKHVGCVLRISEDATEPTGLTGRFTNSSGSWEFSFHEFETERTILAVDTAANTAILNDSVTGSPSARAFSVSTHVDTSPGPMKTLIQRLVEDEYEKVTNSGGEQISTSTALVRRQLVEAQIDDSRKLKGRSQFTPFWYSSRLGDLPAEVEGV